jgi:hypothetical protein
MSLTDITRTKLLSKEAVNLQVELALTHNPVKKVWLHFKFWMTQPPNTNDFFFVNLRETYQTIKRRK